MGTRSVATVFGGSGFIGRYVVKRLAQRGYVVRVAVRDSEGARFLTPAGAVGQVVPLHASVTDDATVARAVDGAELVVNLVGILAERTPGDFQRIQADGPGRIAAACAASNVRRFVQVSAIGADAASPSLYARTKAAGEENARAALPGTVVLRPSIVFGAEDQFFNRFATIASFSFMLPVFHGATRFQPVFVGDVADAVMAAFDREDSVGQTYELGGPEVRSFRQLMEWMLATIGRRRAVVEVPPGLAARMASLFERLPGKPLTQDQLKLLAHDNVVAPGARTLADLGITATPMDLVVPQYLTRFRKGGTRRPAAA